MVKKEKRFQFGLAVVFVTNKLEVTINWSCIGPVSVTETRSFHRSMTDAIEFAVSVQRGETIIDFEN